MQVIRLHHPYEPNQIPDEEVVMALGFFDDVHKGHQEVIEAGRKIAKEKGLKLTVMTFNQRPSIVFQKVLPENMKYLTNLEQKERLIANLGVGILYVVGFTSAFAQLKPQDFVNQYIVNLNSTVTVSGFDCMYGPKEVTGVKQLPTYMRSRFEVVTVLKGEMTGARISSTRVREKTETDGVEEVTELLGYIYEAEGTAVHGDARGRLLGFPTVNVKVRSAVRLSGIGVYAVQIEVGGKRYVGTGSIGHNDTFGEERDLTVEVYILNFHQDTYGEQMVVRWSHYLHDQAKFNRAEASIDQLKQDKQDTAGYFQQSGDKQWRFVRKNLQSIKL